jgi:hypothetical protein
MRISELQTIKPKTPEQLRMAALKKQKEIAQKTIDREKAFQLLKKSNGS